MENGAAGKEDGIGKAGDKTARKDAESLARGYALGVTVLSISSLLVVCPVLGLWLDSRFGTGMLFGAIGFAVGLYATVSQLIRLVNR